MPHMNKLVMKNRGPVFSADDQGPVLAGLEKGKFVKAAPDSHTALQSTGRFWRVD